MADEEQTDHRQYAQRGRHLDSPVSEGWPVRIDTYNDKDRISINLWAAIALPPVLPPWPEAQSLSLDPELLDRAETLLREILADYVAQRSRAKR